MTEHPPERATALSGLPQEPIGFAIVGGMFDPPHVGHVAAVDHACGWGKVLAPAVVVVAGVPPHRRQPVASGPQRLEMTRAAFAGRDWVEVSELELIRGASGHPTYTVDTVHELRRQLPGRTPYLVLGDDRAASLPTWHRYEELLSLVELLVVTRHLDGDVTEYPALRKVRAALPGRPIHWCPMPPIEAASSEVRRRLAHGDESGALELVPDPVGGLVREVYGSPQPAAVRE
jgi:nicotinate-nucleotide adenylyltransferase